MTPRDATRALSVDPAEAAIRDLYEFGWLYVYDGELEEVQRSLREAGVRYRRAYLGACVWKLTLEEGSGPN